MSVRVRPTNLEGGLVYQVLSDGQHTAILVDRERWPLLFAQTGVDEGCALLNRLIEAAEASPGTPQHVPLRVVA